MIENKIKTARKKKGLTQFEIADKAGISVRSYQRYESGERVPDVNHAQLIARALNSRVDELFKTNFSKKKMKCQ